VHESCSREAGTAGKAAPVLRMKMGSADKEERSISSSSGSSGSGSGVDHKETGKRACDAVCMALDGCPPTCLSAAIAS